LVGERLRRWTAIYWGEAVMIAGIPLCLRRARAVATTVWLRRSTTLFCYGVYGAEKWR
jgi:hypothetical protein